MLNVAICDDEIPALQEYGDLVAEFMAQKGMEFRVHKYPSGERLLDSRQDFDILLLDIRMAGMNGMETARRFRERQQNCRLVFITALREYVFEAFQVEASDYLVKPVRREALFAVLERIAQKLQTGTDRCLLLRKGPEIYRIPYAEIRYAEARNHTVVLYTAHGEEAWGEKIERLETELNRDGDFFRCHRSYVVHLRYVRSCEETVVRLTNGEMLPLAKRRRQEFIQALLRFQRKELR